MWYSNHCGSPVLSDHNHTAITAVLLKVCEARDMHA